jgi:hypothetical protein
MAMKTLFMKGCVILGALALVVATTGGLRAIAAENPEIQTYCVWHDATGGQRVVVVSSVSIGSFEEWEDGIDTLYGATGSLYEHLRHGDSIVVNAADADACEKVGAPLASAS